MLAEAFSSISVDDSDLMPSARDADAEATAARRGDSEGSAAAGSEDGGVAVGGGSGGGGRRDLTRLTKSELERQDADQMMPRFGEPSPKFDASSPSSSEFMGERRVNAVSADPVFLLPASHTDWPRAMRPHPPARPLRDVTDM